MTIVSPPSDCNIVNISKYWNKVDFNETNFDDLKTFLNNKLGTKNFSIHFITASEVSIFIDQLNKNSCYTLVLMV